MIGKTIMDISEQEMRAIVQFYLNENLLNTTFQKQHKSNVSKVRQRSGGRFVIEFIADAERPKTMAPDLSRPTTEAAGDVSKSVA